LTCLAGASGAHADEQAYPPGPFVYVGWQDPAFLPRRFRNHCSFDVTLGAYYCSDRCGSDYQFYYCSRWSFGCCRIGVGYCDWGGLLRCRPWGATRRSPTAALILPYAAHGRASNSLTWYNFVTAERAW